MQRTFDDALIRVDDQDPIADASAIGSDAPESTPTRARRKGRALVRPPLPWTGDEPPLRLGKGGGAWFGRDEVHPSQLVHTLAIGQTGCGKTTAVVRPQMAAWLNYELADGKTAAVLVIDPKRELEVTIRSVLLRRGEDDRLVVVGECAPLRFFDADSSLAPAEKLAKLDAVLGTSSLQEGDHSYWHRSGMLLLTDLMALEEAVRSASGGCASLMRILACCRNEAVSRPKEFWGDLHAVLSCVASDSSALKLVANRLSTVLDSHALKEHPSGAALSRFVQEGDLQQLNYRIQTAMPTVAPLVDPEVQCCVDFDPWPQEEGRHTDVRRLVDDGKVILWQPTVRAGDTIVAKVLKSLVYAATYARDELERPIAVVMDEAQRFVTNDSETGEANFLDRCRAYRCNVLLATQSLASLKHAMGSGAHAHMAMEIILANTPSKWFMRSSDSSTALMARALVSDAPLAGAPHVIDARPLASLRPGEAYWVLGCESGRGGARLDGLVG